MTISFTLLNFLVTSSKHCEWPKAKDLVAFWIFATTSMTMKVLLVWTAIVAGCANADCDITEPQRLDGSCNNLENPLWGSAFTVYKRGSEGAEYEDGIKMKVQDRPNERDISNSISVDHPSVIDSIPHNMFAVIFGQFINHDFENNDKEKLFISASEDPEVFASDITITDPLDDFCFFPPLYLPPNASRCDPASGFPQPPNIEYRPSNGTVINGQFEVTNRGTSYLDLDTVYGNDDDTGDALRTKEGGHLRTDDYEGSFNIPNGGGPPIPPIPYAYTSLPPSKASTGLETDTANFGSPNSLLTAGDFRVNNNIGLAIMHTLFLREHNRLADEIAALNETWDDEELYQAARRRNIAQYQKIVLYDYLLAEFGSPFADRVEPYDGYSVTVDATTAAAFAAAAFRYGHSSLRGYPSLDECGAEVTMPPGNVPNIGQTGGPISIPIVLAVAGGIEPAIRGLIATNTGQIDVKYDDGIRNILLPGSESGGVGIDLMALDLQRGRNNGIPNYERLREAYNTNGGVYGTNGCPSAQEKLDNINDPLPCFRQIITGFPGKGSDDEEALAKALRDLYGKVKRMDPIIGLLAEKKVPDTSFGETIGSIIVDQYRRARDGDRFWYENILNEEEISAINMVTMRDLLVRNFDLDLETLPDEVFLAPEDYATYLSDICASSP